jgi:hypothetical protein
MIELFAFSIVLSSASSLSISDAAKINAASLSLFFLCLFLGCCECQLHCWQSESGNLGLTLGERELIMEPWQARFAAYHGAMASMV